MRDEIGYLLLHVQVAIMIVITIILLLNEMCFVIDYETATVVFVSSDTVNMDGAFEFYCST